MRQVLILGAGGHAKVAFDIATEMGMLVVGFLSDDPVKHGESILGCSVLGPIDAWRDYDDVALALGVGANDKRKQAYERCHGASWVTLIHPGAIVSRFASIGEASMVAFGSCVGPSARIGRAAIVNTKASVDHDCEVGDFAHVAVGATLAGTVRIGEGAMVGAGATVIQNLSIGSWAMVGAGATVVRDVVDGVTVVGVPARPIR